jgi:hypothetical protein
MVDILAMRGCAVIEANWLLICGNVLRPLEAMNEKEQKHTLENELQDVVD